MDLASYLDKQSLTQKFKIPTLNIDHTAKPDDETEYPVCSLAELYTKARPSIVEITGIVNTVKGPKLIQQEVSGSGFIVHSDGRVATDFHVIDGAEDLQITTSDGNSYKAKIEKTDPQHDLAILKPQVVVSAQKFAPLILSDDSNNKDDIDIASFGFPFDNHKIFMSLGMKRKTHLRKDLNAQFEFQGQTRDLQNRVLIETSMNSQHGNSGSAVLNMSGKVIGIVYSSNLQNIVELTPVEDLKRLLKD